jgi:hypothetical protein
VWAAANGHDIVRLDGLTGQPKQTINLGDGPLFELRDAGFLAVDGSTAWLTVPVLGKPNANHELWRIDVRTGGVQSRTPITRDPLLPLVAFDHVWLPLAYDRQVWRIDHGDGEIVKEGFGDAPLFVTNGAGSIWAATESGVSEIDPATMTVRREIELVNRTHGLGPMAITYVDGTVWVAIETH